MSCLPWASWAAKKAVQLVGESGGGLSSPVVVDLSEVVESIFETGSYELTEKQTEMFNEAVSHKNCLFKLSNAGIKVDFVPANYSTNDGMTAVTLLNFLDGSGAMGDGMYIYAIYLVLMGKTLMVQPTIAAFTATAT